MNPPTRGYRLLEMVPGLLIWTAFVAAIVLSFVSPLWVMYFIILFDLFWLFRICHFIFLLLVSLRRYRRAIRMDWLALARQDARFEDIRHLIFLPTVREDVGIIRTTLNTLLSSNYPMREKAIVVLAGEGRVGADFLAKAETLRQEFGDRFLRFLVTVHPADLPDEIPGKGSNLNYAGREAQKLIDALGVRYENVIVSSFDVDTCVHREYFGCLTRTYLSQPDPTRASYQPMALYNNNMWESSWFVRVAAFGTTFWLMTELARPEKLFTFASHSMSLRMLVDVGFWQKDIVTEDSRIFLQALVRYDGDYRVVPLYVPVSMDMVMSGDWRKDVGALYKQQRRWAWGVEHFPYMVTAFRGRPNMPFSKKFWHLWNQTEGMFSWAVAPILMFVLGYLPLWAAGNDLRTTVFFQNTPHTLEAIMRLSMMGILIMAAFSFTLLPPRPAKMRHRDYLVMALQWLAVPVTFVLFGALPAVDAQTRLMVGKYLGFNVTVKKR